VKGSREGPAKTLAGNSDKNAIIFAFSWALDPWKPHKIFHFMDTKCFCFPGKAVFMKK